MVDWLSNLQFWKKHCHLVAKFPSNSHFFLFFFCYNIVLAPFKLALKVSKLTISFVSSLELVRQVQAFLPKGKSPQEEQKSIKIQKKTICKKNANIPCLAAMILIFEALFPKKFQICKSQIDTLKAYSIQGPRFSIRMVIGIFCSDTVFVQLNQYSQILRRHYCLICPVYHFMLKIVYFYVKLFPVFQKAQFLQ